MKSRKTPAHLFRIIVALTMIVMMIASLPLVLPDKAGGIQNVYAETNLRNPRIKADNSMKRSNQKVTWDCVWFGSYPQTEIVDEEESCGTYGRDWSESDDCVVDASLYRALQNAYGWDANGDLSLNGKRYRRIEKSDVTYFDTDSPYYNWNSGAEYHYFLYEPIKWRVLSTNGSTALILADKVLDDQRFHKAYEEVTWCFSTMRSFLNGYGADFNELGEDYSSNSFIGTAFSSAEQNGIVDTELANNGSEYTIDKVFLLDRSDVCEDTSNAYGFVSDGTVFDEARRSKSSTYAKAMGLYTYSDFGYDEIDSSFTGHCYWWMRKPGLDPGFAGGVDATGFVFSQGIITNYEYSGGTRPALTLDLSSDMWDYAGTVSSNACYQPISKTHKSFTGVYDNVPREFSGENGFYYADSYFYESATEYNHSLATMSLCMAISAFGVKPYADYDRFVKKLMSDCGFAEDERYKQYHFNEKPEADYIGCAIGSKEIDVDEDTYTLIAVAVRGGGYESEWASNFDVGINGDHNGFDMNAGRVKDYVIDYIQSNNISGKVKIWLTGYSRAAATATQAAAKLDDLSGFAYETDQSENGYNYVDFDNTSIYAYGFATPAGAYIDSDPHSSKYSNIWNIIEYNDPVPLVAQAEWKFDRYGTTRILPYRESNDSKIFKQYNKRISDRLDSGYGYKLRDFKNYMVVAVPSAGSGIGIGMNYRLEMKVNPLNRDSLGTALRKTVKAITGVIGSRKDFNEKYQSVVREIIKSTYAGDDEVRADLGTILDNLVPKLPLFITLHPHLLATVAGNAKLLATVHGDNDYYLAWMQLMDKNYENSLPLIWGNPNYRVFKANCPVDLYVHDSDGNTVASIIDDEPSDYEDQEVVVSIDENEQKTVYLPVDSNYSVEVIAREDCEVSCGVEEFNSLSGDRTRVTNFETMSMAEDETASANIDSFNDSELEEGAVNGSDAEYSIIKNGESIPVDNDLHGSEEISDHSFELKVKYDDAEGTVYGGGLFTEGSYARIEAVANENYIFNGFYINGEKYEDSSSSEGANAVRIKVTKDIEVEAKFTYSPAPDDPDQPVHKHRFRGWEIVKPATEISTGIEMRSCISCDVDETRTIPMLKPTLKAVKITKPKASKGSATIKWKKISKKNLKKIKKVEIQYSMDKSFTNDVKTKYAGAKKTSYKIKGLQKGKKYYVRIRAYTKAGGAVHVSKWSATKQVKIK